MKNKSACEVCEIWEGGGGGFLFFHVLICQWKICWWHIIVICVVNFSRIERKLLKIARFCWLEEVMQ